MKRTNRIISLILVMVFAMTFSAVAFAADDDPLTLKIVSDYEPMARLNNTDTIVHNPKFATGYDIINVIDVSYANGSVNWSAVKADGVNYAFIRAGYRGYSTGDVCTDSQFLANIAGAISAGVKIGVYFYSQAINTREAVEEADYVLKLVNGYNLALPVVFDFEFADDGGSYTGRLYKSFNTKTSFTNICLAFCDRIKACGYDAMVYANPFMLTENLNPESITAHYPIWLANYVDETSYAGDYIMWQFSSKGSVNGISGNVDRSFWYKKQGETSPYLRITSVNPNIVLGETCKINTFFNTESLASLNASYGSISWTSSNEEVATVDQNGVVTPVTEGDVIITASYSVVVPADPSVSGSSAQTYNYSESLNFTCSEKPVESGDMSSILQVIVQLIVSFIKFLVSLFSSMA